MLVLKNIFKNIKNSILDYYIIWPQVVIFQILARLTQFLVLGFIGGYLFKWTIKDSTSLSLVNFDILSSVYFDRLIFAVPLAVILGLVSFFFEYLGVIYICDTYYNGDKISLPKTLLQIIKTTPEFVRSIFIQMVIYFGILISGGIISMGFWIILPKDIALFFIGVTILTTLFFFISALLRLVYVNFKIFDKHKTVFGLFDYRLTKKQFTELTLYYFLILLLSLLGFFIGGIFINFVLSSLPSLTNSIAIVSVVSSIVLSLSIILTTVLNVIFTGILTTYRSLIYHQEFSVIKKFQQGHHDYSYESRAVEVWKRHYRSIITTAVLILTVFVIFQSLSINSNIKLYLDRDFITISHRGGSGFAENTLEAVNQSINDGIDMIEVDIQLTKDGIPILFHDQDLTKIGSKLLVNQTELSQIDQLAFPTGEKVPTLDQLLEITKNKIGLNLELKVYDGDNKLRLVNSVLDVLENYQSNQEIIFTSLDYEIVDIIESIDSRIETGLIITASIGDLNQYKTNWFIVNDIFFATSKNEFKNTNKKIALWSFSPDWDGGESFSEGLDGGITDLPRELITIENDFENLPNSEKVIQSLLWSI